MDRDLLIEVSIFLRETLSKEKLSDHAESFRKKLLQKLDFREASPQAYIDMNGPTKGSNKVINIQNQISECYEEVDRITPDKDRRCSEPITLVNHILLPPLSSISNNKKSNLSINNTYNNIETVLSEMFLNKEIKPEIPLKKSAERNSLPNSVINSNRNSVSSLKKDSPDRISTSSSIVPDAMTNLSSTSSSKSSEDNTEVLTMSASAVRYSAMKYGTLMRKDKFLFVDIMKQYWVALLGQVIYVYTSEKDNKPCLEINVTGYQARPVELRDSNKKDCSFEVFSPGKRTFQFTAQTSTEMDHWISVICQAGKVPEMIEQEPIVVSKNKEPVRQLPSIPSDLLYDHPDSAVRPVNGGSRHQIYEMMQEPGEDVYHYIEHDTKEDKGIALNESSLYKNIDVPSPLKGCIEEDNMYYNLIPCPDVEEDRDEECIYDVISEKHIPGMNSLQIKKHQTKATTITTDSTKTTQNEIKKPGTAISSHSVIIQDEIYELVN